MIRDLEAGVMLNIIKAKSINLLMILSIAEL